MKIVRSFVWSAVLLAGASGSYGATGLMAYYPFNGDARDHSGHEAHGVVDDALLTVDGFGHADSAYAFDGSEDSIVSSPSLPVGNAARSISAWFRTRSDRGSSGMYNNTIVSWGTPATNQLCAVAVYQGELIFDPYGWDILVDTGEEVSDGLWHHVVVTYDGAVVTVYLDNQPVATAARTLGTASSDLYIGARSGQTHQDMDGSIDEVRVYDRVLSVQEVARLYRGMQPAFGGSFESGTLCSWSRTAPPTVCESEFIAFSNASGWLGVIDVGDGSWDPLADLSAVYDEDLDGLAFCPQGLLYATGKWNSELVTVNRTTYEVTTVGITSGCYIRGLAYRHGMLLGLDSDNNKLVEIRTESGYPDLIGSLAPLFVNSDAGLAYCARSNTLYAIAYQPPSLFEIDPFSGAATEVGALGVIPCLDAALACDPESGELYGLLNSLLYRINRDTGAVTYIGDPHEDHLDCFVAHRVEVPAGRR